MRFNATLMPHLAPHSVEANRRGSSADCSKITQTFDGGVSPDRLVARGISFAGAASFRRIAVSTRNFHGFHGLDTFILPVVIILSVRVLLPSEFANVNPHNGGVLSVTSQPLPPICLPLASYPVTVLNLVMTMFFEFSNVANAAGAFFMVTCHVAQLSAVVT